ncbi:MAG: AAA family ATPase, partial [Burkholderiales bacterium]
MTVAVSPIEQNPLFGQLPLELSENLRSINPWWRADPSPPLPRFRRWPFERLKRLLENGMAPATVLRGPRRIGKTVLLRQIIEEFLSGGVAASRILYIPFDELPTLAGLEEPILAIARWFEKAVLQSTLNAAARQGKPAYLLLDEVQN